jgi:hypothetical protein
VPSELAPVVQWIERPASSRDGREFESPRARLAIVASSYDLSRGLSQSQPCRPKPLASLGPDDTRLALKLLIVGVALRRRQAGLTMRRLRRSQV